MDLYRTKSLDPDYPDTGELKAEKFEFGTKIDIKLKDRKKGEELYVYNK